ncbi:MAG: hypothetical protein HOM68_12165 [Gemmatimonadetes bacterium]|nr:hypothetical protein [Gemmatimonadota bacterium]MBT5588598.1 hypothetical protein [Gemmatimonadota bacterium]MBT5962578.1 hypothetical protein [Gemmatimonadota bacterium]MBT7456488.1 hypothetical protein [Gemmatimonadota bacterium]
MRWALLAMINCLMICAPSHADAAARTANQEPRVNRRLLALRQEYNEVAAALDTLVYAYGVERISRLTDPQRSLLSLPQDHRLILLIWADDEAQIYLNGAPVAKTRLTPTRTEIPSLYIEATNELAIHAWDTDRVEAAVMLGLYVEDPTGALHPVVTTQERYGWVTGDGTIAPEMFYSHSFPDLPGAVPMWGPQLFGEIWISTTFEAAQVLLAAQESGLDATTTGTRDQPMDFHRSIGRLVGLQERRQELQTRLERLATKPDPHLRTRRTHRVSPLSYTLGAAAPFVEWETLETTLEPLKQWQQQLPSSQQELLLQETRVLRGPEAATAVEPLEVVQSQLAGQRRSDYTPPAEQRGTRQQRADAGQVLRIDGPSWGFILRMALLGVLLTGWAGFASWCWWTLYVTVQWSEPKGSLHQ